MANCPCVSNQCNPCYYFSRLGNSVSTWCSNGALSSETVRYAYLAQLGELATAENAPVMLSSITMFTQGFSLTDGQLYAVEPGSYRAEYILHLPPLNESVTFWLQAGDAIIPGSQVTVTAGTEEKIVVNQSIFDISGAAMVSLYTNAALNLTAENEEDAVASLTLVKL